MAKGKKKQNWEHSIKILLAGFLSASAAASADAPLGLVGGQQNSDAYAAFLSNPSGAPFNISGLPSNATIEAVAMNSSGYGLIGGQINSSIPFAAAVFPDGTFSPLNLSMSAGNVYSIAVNESGFGLLGGIDNGLDSMYVAQVAPDGTVNVIPVPDIDTISPIQISLNDSDVGLIAAEGSVIAYAAYIAPNGTVTQVANTPTGISTLLASAINSSGTGIVGGRGDDFVTAYAAFVTPGGPSPLVLSPLPADFAYITTVAINDSGSGLVGGIDGSSNAYAGYAASDGTVTTLFPSPFPGSIQSVALNAAGTGLIGGQNNSNFYAAFVQSDGTVTPIFTSSTAGSIYSVAINQAGLGLLGGQTGSSEGYLALVAPNRTLTPIVLPAGVSTINSVALQTETLNSATPGSMGPYGSTWYMQLAAVRALENRFIQQNRIWKNGAGGGNIASNDIYLASSDIALSPKTSSTPLGTAPVLKENSIWLEPFGNYIHVAQQGSIPSLTNEIGGALLGYDRQGSNYIVGLTLGYAFNYVDYSQSLGHAKIQEEMASLYGAYYTDHFWFALAAWGGLYQLDNTRHTLSFITSKGHTHGWIFDPHLELATPWEMGEEKLYYIEPFVQFDWVNNWQNAYTESGSSGLNVHMPSIYNSLLQTEAGLRFYEKFVFGWGDFCFEEKLSYINMAPFDVNGANAFFIGSASSFPVAVGSQETQNLGAIQLLGSFVPKNPSAFYGGFSFEAAVGSSFQSYFIGLFGGKDF